MFLGVKVVNLHANNNYRLYYIMLGLAFSYIKTS